MPEGLKDDKPHFSFKLHPLNNAADIKKQFEHATDNSHACIRARIASCLKHNGSHLICAGARSASARLRCPIAQAECQCSACTSMLVVTRRSYAW